MSATAVNFRLTAGYVTDDASETYSLGGADTYPTTRNGVTFGLEAGSNWEGRDQDNTNDRRLAGINFDNFGGGGAPQTFRVDLPAAGSYDLRLAVGSATFGGVSQYVEIQDTTTSLLTVTGTTNAQEFRDALGTLLTNVTWPGSNVASTKTFASTILRLIVGDATRIGSVAHLSFVAAVTSGYLLVKN